MTVIAVVNESESHPCRIPVLDIRPVLSPGRSFPESSLVYGESKVLLSHAKLDYKETRGHRPHLIDLPPAYQIAA